MSISTCNTLTACPIQEQTLRMLSADTNKAFLVATDPDSINSPSSEDLLKSIGLYNSADSKTMVVSKENMQKTQKPPAEMPRVMLANNRASFVDHPGDTNQNDVEVNFRERCNRIIGKKICDDFTIDEIRNRNTPNYQIQRNRSFT